MSKNFIADKATLDAVKVVVDAMSALWTQAVANKIEGISQTASTIHSTVMTNNTANATGILSQKLSYIINQLSGQSGAIGGAARRRATKIASVSAGGYATTTLLEVTGSGELVLFHIGGEGTSNYNTTLVIDGVSHTVVCNAGRTYGLGKDFKDGKMITHLADTDRFVQPICFAKSCKLTMNNPGTTTIPCKVLYNTFDYS